MEKRITAQDNINRGNFLFGHTTSFEKTYPKVENIKIIFKEEGSGVYDNKQVYDKESISEYINCSNKLCQRGGFWIGREIADMYHKKEENKKGNLKCYGDEGSPKGRIKGRNCFNHIEFEINIEYKKE